MKGTRKRNSRKSAVESVLVEDEVMPVEKLVPPPEPPPAAEGTPRALGFRMPAEWEPHAATWLSWPRRDGISFPDSYDAVLPALAKMVGALADSEPVRINVRDEDEERIVREQLRKHRARCEHVEFFHIPTNEPWCR